MKTFRRTSSRGACAVAGAACLLLCALTTDGSTRTQTRRHSRQQKTRAESAAANTPMSLDELLKSLGARGLKTAKLIKELEARGVSFSMTPEEEAQLANAGARPEVIDAARSNYRPATQQDSALAASVVVAAPKFVPSPVKQDTSDIPNDVPRPMPNPEAPGLGGMSAGPGVSASGGYGGGYGPGYGYIVGDGGGGKVDYSRTFRPGEVTRKAVVTAKPEPSFTEKAGENMVEGVVRLRVILSADGSVKVISVVKGLPDGLTEKAIAAAKQIRFTPAQKDGRKVSQYATLEYNFYISAYDEKNVTCRAVILEKPAPKYTAEARSNGVSGKVVLKVLLLSSGVASFLSVEQSLPYGLTEKAIEAAQRIKFTPAEKDGRAVTQSATIEYEFKP